MDETVILLNPKDHEIKLVKDFGYKLALFKTHISLEDSMEADYPVEVNLNDLLAVIKEVKLLADRTVIKAVYTTNEYRVLTASYIANELSLSNALPLKAAEVCRNKKITRKLLNEMEKGHVQYSLVKEESEIEENITNFSFPVIVKPANYAGSKNVSLCKDLKEVKEAVNLIKNDHYFIPLDPDVVIEEFLNGPEYSIESFTVKGNTTILAITEKNVVPFPFSTEVGHIVPASVSPFDEELIRNLVLESLSLIGIDNAVTHTEVILTEDGPKIVEINARPGGDKIPSLVKTVTGFDLSEISFHLAVHGHIDHITKYPKKARYASSQFLISEASGNVSYNGDVYHPALIEKQIYVENDEEVVTTTCNFDRLGYFIVEESSRTELKRSINEIHQLLDLKVNQKLNI